MSRIDEQCFVASPTARRTFTVSFDLRAAVPELAHERIHVLREATPERGLLGGLLGLEPELREERGGIRCR
jgi:hypothetical protein